MYPSIYYRFIAARVFRWVKQYDGIGGIGYAINIAHTQMLEHNSSLL